MADTKIEWADKVWNPVVGCTKCSPGCLNCYAERFAARLWRMGRGDYGSVLGIEDYKWNGEIFCRNGFLDRPLHWRKPSRIFVCSMSDLFHPKVPFDFIDKVLYVMYRNLQHTFQILTKRPERMLEYFADGELLRLRLLRLFPNYTPEARLCREWPLNNVHLGVSISNQAEADEKIPIPAAVRWLSIEPMLEAIDLHISDSRKDILWRRTHGGAYERQLLGWVVLGGESGPKARPMHPDWARNIRDQCIAAGVPFFMKQMGGHPNKRAKLEDIPKDLRIRELICQENKVK